MIGWPNRFTLLRILLVPLFVGCLIYLREDTAWLRWAALFVFAAACFTDALDGWLARFSGRQSRLGSILDPLADKTLLLGAYLALSTLKNLPSQFRVPAWITVAVVSRDILILSGAVLMFFYLGRRFTPTPSFWGKWTTAAQMALVAGVLAGAPDNLKLVVAGVVALLTVISGGQYAVLGLRMLNAEDRLPAEDSR